MAQKQYLDLSGLSSFKGLIQTWANSASQLAYKTVIKSTDGNNIYFYKKPNAVEGTDTPDETISLGNADMQGQLDALATIAGATWVPATGDVEGHYTIDLDNTFDVSTVDIVDALNELKGQINILNGSDSTSGSVAKSIKDAVEGLDVSEFDLASVSNNVVTIKGIKEVDGKIAVGDGNGISLEEVAYTGAAADVSIADAAGKITATDVEGALAELADAAADQAIYMTDNTSTVGTDYAAIYKIYQGTGSASSPVQDELVGTINIPKDQFIEDAELVDVYFDDTDNSLHEGSISGPDVTEAIKGAGGTATAADAGKYFKLVFELTTGPTAKSTIYISIKELSHVYTGGTTAEATVAIDSSTDVITVTINDIAATKITYIAAQEAHGNPGDPDYEPAVARESVGAALTRLDGTDSVTGSVAKKIKDAIGGLDTINDVAIASYDSSTTAIIIQNGIKEEDGIIAQGTGDGIVISPIDTADIQALFA